MRLVAAVAAVFVAVTALVFLVVRPRSEAPVSGLRAVGSQPFGDGDVLAAVAVRAVLDPTGGRLAVITDDGLSVAEDGGLRRVTARGSHVVDAAWFANGTTLLVAEGPIPTGGLAVVDIDGRVRGTIPLSPSVGFGGGNGMAVLPGGKRAVVTAVERPALQPEQRYLALVDLETGATSSLTEPGGPDESGPVPLDDGRIAFTERGASGAGGGDAGATVRIVDPVAGGLDGAGAGTVVGAADRAVVVRTGRELRLRPLGADGAGAGRLLVTIPDGATAVGADPGAGEAVVLDRAGKLRRLRFDRVRIPR